MFGRRPDGKQIKGIDGITKLTPLLMRSREGAANYFIFQEAAKYYDNYIAAKKEEGKEYTYRDLSIAMMIRLFRLHPRLNRFITAGRFYQRNWIDVSMMVHKSLRTGESETAIKARFTGDETLDEIKDKLDKTIYKAVFETNATDNTTDFFGKLPHFLLRTLAGGVRLFDRWGLLSDKFLSESSPFHCSIFFSDLKSIGLDTVHHHLYNFGNCGFFAAMGKEKAVPIVDPETGEIRAEKVFEIGVSMDERFIDGLYYARVVKTIRRIIKNFACLERPPEEREINRLKTDKEIKAEKKEKKKQAKLEKKNKKKKTA